MRTIYVITAPSGYWEEVFQSFEGAQDFLKKHFPSYKIVAWDAKLSDLKEQS